MRRLAIGLVPLVCLGLTSCDTPEKIEGLEREVEALVQQQAEAAKTLSETQSSLEEASKTASSAKAEVDALTARVDEQSSKITLLEDEIAELEEKQEAPPEVKPTVRAGRPDPAERYKVNVGDSPVRGPDDAKITVVIFSDFQCPFCKRVQDTLKEVEREYGKDVRIVAKHNPLAFHREALPAALASEAAHRQGKFWEMHDKLYENNRDLYAKNFEAWAKEIGCNLEEFRKDIKDSGLEDRIEDDRALAMKLGARGTPAFFVNGRFLSGAQPFPAFKRLIDEEMKEAERRMAAGVSKSDVYEDLMRGAKSGV